VVIRELYEFSVRFSEQWYPFN